MKLLRYAKSQNGSGQTDYGSKIKIIRQTPLDNQYIVDDSKS